MKCKKSEYFFDVIVKKHKSNIYYRKYCSFYGLNVEYLLFYALRKPYIMYTDKQHRHKY